MNNYKYLLYLLTLICFFIVYSIYKIKNKMLLNNKTKNFVEIIFFLTLISFIFVLMIANPIFRYSINFFKAIFIMLSLSLLCFSLGIIINKEKTYKNNINIYIILYMILLISITFIIGRPTLEINFERLKNIYKGSLIPFNTISLYFSGYASMKSIIYNVFGNAIMLVPLSFLLMIKNKKFNNIFRQLLIIFPIVIFIELFQQITWVGSFDIDDIILNISGPILFTLLITRFNIIDKIRQFFYNDFIKKRAVKYFIYIVSIIFPILFIIETISKIFSQIL